MANAIARSLLTEIADALESDPELADRVRRVLGISDQQGTIELKDCGIRVKTLRAAIRSGELVASKVGRNYRVHRADLEAWLKSRRVAPKRDKPPEEKLTAAERAIQRARRAGSLRAIPGGA